MDKSCIALEISVDTKPLDEALERVERLLDVLHQVDEIAPGLLGDFCEG